MASPKISPTLILQYWCQFFRLPIHTCTYIIYFIEVFLNINRSKIMSVISSVVIAMSHLCTFRLDHKIESHPNESAAVSYGNITSIRWFPASINDNHTEICPMKPPDKPWGYKYQPWPQKQQVKVHDNLVSFSRSYVQILPGDYIYTYSSRYMNRRQYHPDLKGTMWCYF